MLIIVIHFIVFVSLPMVPATVQINRVPSSKTAVWAAVRKDAISPDNVTIAADVLGISKERGVPRWFVC